MKAFTLSVIAMSLMQDEMLRLTDFFLKNLYKL